jgi:hypothetical protein
MSAHSAFVLSPAEIFLIIFDTLIDLPFMAFNAVVLPRGDERIDWVERRLSHRRIKATPRPPPPRLDRRLSISLLPAIIIPPKTGILHRRPRITERGRTIAQVGSKLLSLPAEIRTMIFEAVLSRYRFHIVVRENAKKLGHIRCKQNSSAACRFEPTIHKRHHGFYEKGIYSRKCLEKQMNKAYMYRKRKHTDGGIMPLLLACRQTYATSLETAPAVN